jgi:hypothetical protein
MQGSRDAGFLPAGSKAKKANWPVLYAPKPAIRTLGKATQEDLATQRSGRATSGPLF